jgi:hypothetical protein
MLNRPGEGPHGNRPQARPLFGPLAYGRGAGQTQKESTMDIKTLLIILLLAAVGVLGYLYYDSQQTQVRIDVPGFKLEAK